MKKFRNLAMIAGVIALAIPAIASGPATATPAHNGTEVSPAVAQVVADDVQAGDLYNGREVLSVQETAITNTAGGICDQILAITPDAECAMVDRVIELEPAPVVTAPGARMAVAAATTCKNFVMEKSAVTREWGFSQEVRWCYNGSKAWVFAGSPKGYQDCGFSWGALLNQEVLSCTVRTDGTAKATAFQQVKLSFLVQGSPIYSTCKQYAHLTKSGGRTFERSFC